MLDIVQETRDHEAIAVGVSPRGAIALRRAAQARALLDGRDYCIPEDVRELVISHGRSVTLPEFQIELAYNAGVAAWRGNRDVNARSIGIELANPGHEFV